MASILGQLLVELGINTAAFKDGLDKATYQAKQFAGDLSKSFGALGDSVAGLGQAFGGLSPAMSGAVGGIKSALEPLLSSMGTAGGMAAGIAVAFAAAGVGAIAAAVNFSETAARLNDLSQATGISVESLSVLGQIASTKGIDVETMAKAMEKMDKAALAAAQSGPHAANAFKDLGIAVTDANGNLRDAQEIFDDVSKKFAAMPDGPVKTAEAIKIFGRAGANMIPLLNEGGEKLKELGDHFTALNSVISGPTAEASEQLKENMTLMGAAFTGVQNELTADLVPALNVVAERFVSFFEENASGIKAFVDGVANVAKVVINVFQEVGALFAWLYQAIYGAVSQIQNVMGTIGQAFEDAKNGNWSAFKNDFTEGWKTAASELKNTWSEMGKTWDSTMAGMVASDSAELPGSKKKKGGGDAVTPKPVDMSFVDKEVEGLERLEAKEETLAGAIGQRTQSQIEANAAAQADLAITKLQDEAKAKGPAAMKALADMMGTVAARIREATTFTAAFQAAIGDQAEIDKFNKKIGEQIQALEDEGKASTDIERQWAKTTATLKPLQDSLAELTNEYNKLAAEPGHDPKKLADLAAAVATQTAEVNKEADAVARLNQLQQQANVAKELQKINDETLTMKTENDALIAGNPYGKMEATLAIFLKNQNASVEQAQALTAALKAQEAEQAKVAALSDLKGTAGVDPAGAKAREAEAAQLKDMWDKGQISAQAYYMTLAKIDAETADAAAKSGTMGQGIKAAFADFNATLQSDGQIMQQVVGTGIKGITQNFSDMITKGKADWSGLISSMEEQLIKSQLSKLISGLISGIEGAFGGGGLGSFGSSFMSGFGGGHAEGGDVTPGKTYLVGEKGPELFSSGVAGNIIPNSRISGAGPGGGDTHVSMYVNTPDANSFGKSSSQLVAGMYRQVGISVSRNRG